MKMHVKIIKSHLPKKKYDAVFKDSITGQQKIIPFGATGYEDYTIHKDKIRRDRYILRHSRKRKNEDWTDPMSAGALSRFILWGDSTDINKNIKDYHC